MGLNNKCRQVRELEARGFRKCARCDEVKPLGAFSKTPPNGKKRCYCFVCARIRAREYTRKNPGRYNDAKKAYREKNRKTITLRNRCNQHGLTVPDYLEIFRKQNGRCKICGVSHLEVVGGLFIDHNHETDKVRGLLCPYCNKLLGFAKDNTTILRNAIEYLEVETAGSYIQESNF